MRQVYYDDLLDESEYNGKLYGLGKAAVQMTNGSYDTQSAHGLVQYGRSAVTSAERERTPPREQAGMISQSQSQQNVSQQGMGIGGPSMLGGGPASMPTPGAPGMGGYPNPLSSPYGAIPVGVNGAYHLRQIGVGGDR